MGKEARDAVKDERPFAGVHILATALLCAGASTPDELELARRILVRDPKQDGPRENESIAGAFNRQMDAAIDSVNDSAGMPTRAARRAILAGDLQRAGLVLIDREQVALLIAVVAELRAEIKELEGEELGAELADGEEIDALAEELELHRTIDREQAERYDRDPLGLEFDGGRGELDPRVND